MNPSKQKLPVLAYRNLFYLFSILAQLFFIADLSGQTKKTVREIDEPVFIIRVEQTGQSDDIYFTSTLEKTYSPCSQWVGGSGGFTGTPSGFVSNAGGLGGLRPKMGIPYYAKKLSGSAQGSDGSSATVVTNGDGLGLWTEQLGDNKCTRQDDPADLPSHNMSARFERTEKGARITFNAGLVSAGCGTYIGFVNIDQMDVDQALIRQFCTFEITNEELNNWKQLKKENRQIFSDDNGKLTVVATLFAEIESPIEVEVNIADYDTWMPQGNLKSPEKAGSTLIINATVKTKDATEKNKDAKITFTLNNVSSEPGICLNGPQKDGWDMEFSELFNPTSQFEVFPDEITTRSYVTEANAVISSYDFGATAEFSVKAEDQDGNPVKVVLQGKERTSIFLPKRELGGRIADAWRNKEGVEGLSDDWDEVEINGQPEKGDGLDLYSKYRGLLVVTGSGKIDHIRLPAKEKVHFVIDRSNIFDFKRWQASSGIHAYRMIDETTRNRQVDFNSSSASPTGGKYAVEIEMIKGTIEKDPMPQDKASAKDGRQAGDKPYQYAYTVGYTPRKTTRCRVFPDRISAMLERVVATMRKALDNPDAPENAEEIATLKSLGRPLDAIRQRLNAIDEKEIKILTDMMVKLSAIHEMGHACGINGHLNDLGDEDDTLLRSPECPMNYLYIRDRRLFILDRALGGEGQFCRTDPDNCWEYLNVK